MGLNLSEKVNDLKDYAQKGLQDFKENPIEYSGKAIGQGVKDYLDLGVASIGMYLMIKNGKTNPIDNGEFIVGWTMAMGGILAPAVIEEKEAKIWRMERNILMGAGLIAQYSFGENISALVLYSGSALFEHKRQSGLNTPSAPPSPVVEKKEETEELTDLLNIQYEPIN